MHTPGPWSVSNRTAYAVTAPDGSTVAMTAPGNAMQRPEDIANARLIAAAPDLLAALETALEEFHHPGAYRDGCARVGDFSADLTAMITAALAKARGQ